MFIRRLIQLHLGLCLFGFALALMVRATLGLDPWNVFQQGLTGVTGLTLGQVSIAIGVVVMLAWIPLRQKPGYGTIGECMANGTPVVYHPRNDFAEYAVLRKALIEWGGGVQLCDLWL